MGLKFINGLKKNTNIFKNRVVKNAGWLIAAKVVQSILSIVVTIISARFLGPSSYGLVSYAASVVSFVTPITLLGLGNIQVQEYINHPEEEGKILGSSVAMSCVSAVFCIIGVISFSLIANVDSFETTIIVSLYSTVLFFQATELIMYWFQAKYLNKYYAIVGLIAYVSISSYKIFILVFGLSIKLFALSNAFDYFLITMILFIIYKKKGGNGLKIDRKTALRLFKRSRHYIIPNLMISIFTQTDHIMIKHMIDDVALGYYTAATTCAAYANFVFTAIIDSSRPSIFENYKISEENFEKSVIRLYSIVIYLAISFGIIMMIFSPIAIKILYGDDYKSSINSLMIVSWFPLFSFVGSVRNVWVLAKNRQKFLWVVNMLGAGSNIVLNFILIPFFGIEGAATASLFTQCLTNVIFTAIFRPYRRSAILMLKSLKFYKYLK